MALIDRSSQTSRQVSPELTNRATSPILVRQNPTGIGGRMKRAGGIIGGIGGLVGAVRLGAEAYNYYKEYRAEQRRKANQLKKYKMNQQRVARYNPRNVGS